MNKKISIIIPVFNREERVGIAVDSVLKQSYTDIEILLVDDASTDNTVSVIKQKYNSLIQIGKIEILSNSRTKGPAGSRNTGVLHSNAEYLAFLDSDDEFCPEKIEKQFSLMEKKKELLYCHSDELWFFQGQERRPKKKHKKCGGFFFERALELCLISPSAVLMRKEFFSIVGLWNEKLLVAEDYELWLRALNNYPAGFIDEALTIKHGGHSGQLSSSYYNIDLFRIYALMELLQTEYFTFYKRSLIVNEMKKKWRIMEKGAVKKGKVLNSKIKNQIMSFYV